MSSPWARLDSGPGTWQNWQDLVAHPDAVGAADGGVGVPVGLAVFKTVGGSLCAVSGGFDSHTPLPLSPWLYQETLTFHQSGGRPLLTISPDTFCHPDD